jgi:hypothetical protein
VRAEKIARWIARRRCGIITGAGGEAMKPCRECQRQISDQALACPGCGAPYPAKPRWDGWGFEYVSPARIGSLPLLHVSFKFRPNRRPVVARGVFAVGQFAVGIVTISQFGVGVLSLSQFTLAGWAISQIGIAYAFVVTQFGVCWADGRGQFVIKLAELLGWR